ncbi:MAG: PIG-L family deacetylase [Acidobacteria bacterium]|nr:PIG-L family deacetylase [Acidobacteriota bacterium]
MVRKVTKITNTYRLNVLGSLLMIAAHPDDENTAVIAYFARGRHMRTAYLSATRGEGGQNLIGPEQYEALGLIRTQELLAARRIDGGEQFFTRAFDFGYSKNPEEALEKWGRDRLLADFVRVIRRFRPDVIVTRFPPEPGSGGHGQHTATGHLAPEAFEAAADPKRFTEQIREGLQPWCARRLLWNTFSFSRQQEEAEAKSPNRLVIDAGRFDPVLGKSYAEIAGESRSMHASQGFPIFLKALTLPGTVFPERGG